VVISSNRQIESVATDLIRMKPGDGVVEFQSVPDGAIIREERKRWAQRRCQKLFPPACIKSPLNFRIGRR
jgi:hypothetical protein